jgi:hypothetical protein
VDHRHGSLPDPPAHGVSTERGFLPDDDPLTAPHEDPVPDGASDALDVEHATTNLIDHLRDMRPYMPPAHRELVVAFETTTRLRDYVADTDPALVDAYNDVIDALHDFRKIHLSQVLQYIVAATGDATGTGGTNFMEFLATMRTETADTGL